jgi:hypothetical protein
MPASVTLALDTTAPTLAVSSGQAPGDPTLVTLDISTDDAVEMRVWGAIDDTDPLNASYAVHEADAPWIPYDAAPQVRAHPLGGTLSVRVRDDVYNESAAESVEIVTGTAPAPTPAPAPVPFRAPTPRAETRTVITRSRIRVRTEHRVDRTPQRREALSRSIVRVRSRDERSAPTPNSSRLIVRSRGHHAGHAVGGSSALMLRSRSQIVRREQIGPDTQAVLVALDII